MTKLISLLIILITFSLVSPTLVHAQPVGSGASAPHNSIIGQLTGAIALNSDLETPMGIINMLLPPIFTLAGLTLLGMIIWGGFDLLTAGTDAKKADAGKTRVSAAIIGFIIIFSAYWIAQILQIVFGVSIVDSKVL